MKEAPLTPDFIPHDWAPLVSAESNGARHLRGCYADHDDLHSRLRVLRRGRTRLDQHPASNDRSPTNEVPA